MKILIAGATGFVGKHLVDFLLKKGYSINILTRKQNLSPRKNLTYFKWDLKKGFIDANAFQEVEVIFNLAGENIGQKRWTNKRKKEILESRIESTQLIYEIVKKNNFNIKMFISSSAVGYYGAVTPNEILTEKSPNGNDFLGEICRKWEESALKFEDIGVKTIILRKGVVIGKDGGIYQKLSPLAKWGINTALGNGKQFLPWIDIRDLARLYEFILTKSGDISGVYNVVASEFITMNEFSTQLLQSFNKKSFLPNVPQFMVKLLFGEMAIMLLEGPKISNQKLIDLGFVFEYEQLKKSIDFAIFT